MMNFHQYYESYLGIDYTTNKSEKVFACEQRNKPLALEFIQLLIATKLNGKIIFSIAPDYYQEFRKFIDFDLFETINDELINKIHNFFSKKFTDFSIRKMDRLTLEECTFNFKATKARTLTTNDKEIFFNTGTKTKKYKQEQWDIRKKAIEEGRVFVIIENNKIVSWAEISDIDFNGGNIVVITLPEYRNLGYGKSVVTEAVKWCIENNVIPIYWVDPSNVPSLKLASSLGFKIMAQEVVVSIKRS